MGELKVIKKTEALSLEQQNTAIRQSNLTIFITAIIGIVTIFLMWFFHNKALKNEEENSKQKQIDLLKSLFTELDVISNKAEEGNLQWFLNSIENGDPLHSVWNINPSPYLSFLSQKGNEKDIGVLKKKIVQLNQKIEMINNIVLSGKYQLIKNNPSRPQDQDMVKFVKATLNEVINLAEEMKKILKILIK